MHNCTYCNAEVLPCTHPCSIKDDEHTCCVCDTELQCALPVLVVCSNAICQFKLKIELQALKLAELESATKLETQKLKELKSLNNDLRIFGIGPQSLEVLIANHTVSIPGLTSTSSETFHWGMCDTDTLVTTGLTFLTTYEKVMKQWAAWLNEKSALSIKKEQLQATQKKIKEAQAAKPTEHKIRDRKSTRLNSSHIQKSRMPSSA